MTTDPIILYKMLRRQEVKAHKLTTAWANGEIFINDIKSLKDKQSCWFGLNIYTDWGGYGIIAPEFEK